MNSSIQHSSPASQARADEAGCGGEAPEHLDDWTAEIALIVAATLEPSCALAFCFGNGVDTKLQGQVK